MKKNLILVGKKSFLGSNINSYLKKKVNIKLISFEKFKKLKQNYLKKFNYICNCSITKNYSVKKYKKKYDLDYYIVKKINKLNIKYIFISSRKVYFPKANISENGKIKPVDIYAKNKYITEKKIQSILKKRYLILRVSNIIGKQKKNHRKVTQNFIDNYFLYKKRNKITYYKNFFKDFLSIKQFTSIFYKILENNLSGTFNISLGKKVYISQILYWLNKKKVNNKYIKIPLIDNKGSFYLNNKKLKKKIKLKILKYDLMKYCLKIDKY